MAEAERKSGEGRQLCPCQCHPDFSWMRFGDSRIHPSDVDCMFVVERRGKFLWLEWKEIREQLTKGQQILMQELSKIPGFTVVLLRGEGGNPRTIEVISGGNWGNLEFVTMESFQSRLDTWYERANSPRK